MNPILIKILIFLSLIPILVAGSFCISVLFHEYLHTKWDLPGYNQSICIDLDPKNGRIAYATSSVDTAHRDMGNHFTIYYAEGMVFMWMVMFSVYFSWKMLLW